MLPYHAYDSPLERSQAVGSDKKRDTLLNGFRDQIQSLGLIIDPDARIKRMASVVKEWIPAMEKTGLDRGQIGEVVLRLQHQSVNDIGRLAKRMVDAFYCVRDRPPSLENSRSGGDKWIETLLDIESAVRTSVSQRVLSRFGMGDSRGSRSHFEMQDIPIDAALLGVEDLEDEDEEDWLTIKRQGMS